MLRDSFYIETHLNDCLDQLLSVPVSLFQKKIICGYDGIFTSKLSRAKLDALYSNLN